MMPGYFQPAFWPTGYWAADYWPEYGTAAPVQIAEMTFSWRVRSQAHAFSRRSTTGSIAKRYIDFELTP